MELKFGGQVSHALPTFPAPMLLRARTVIAPGWETLLRASGLDTVAGVYHLGAGQVITHSGSTEVRRVQVGTGSDARTVFIKKYWVRRPSQLWGGMFRGTFFGRSKVRREYDNLFRLRAGQMDAPEPVACGEERHAGWLLRSFLISQGVAEPMPLHHFICRHLPGLPVDEARMSRRQLIENLAEYTRRLHEHRFVHHDYFWRNILLSGHGLRQFFLIDAHKGRRWLPWEERRARAKDLAALDAPAPNYFRRTERLHFFLRYRGHRMLHAEDKELLRLTLRLAAPMREKQLRRARGK
jgi:hypothetical protein